MTPTRIAALRAMAAADDSPHEQEIARTKLAEAGIPIEPPRPPAPPSASPFPGGWFSWTATTGAASSVSTFSIRVTVS